MAYVRQARIDSNKKIMITVSCLAIILVLVSIGIFITNEKTGNKETINISSKVEQAKQVNLLRTNRKIQAGEAADISKFEFITVPKELVPEGAVTAVQLLKGKRLTNNLEKSEFILQSDLVDSSTWYEEGDRLMEHTFQDGAIPATVDVGSVVDIKLFKQGASDMVVVSKAAVIGKNQNTLSFYLNSEEQEFLKEANTEGQLFLVQYLDKAQTASMITYYPSYNKGQASKQDKENFVSTSMVKE